LNLIVNGCDAMAGQERAKRLTLRTRRENGEIWAEIQDEGTGIPEGDLQRIFEPFVTNKAQGTGLGLSVCRTIVSSHGGRIWARNNAGSGATVAIALPVSESANS
jgi:signal transduction histidine kinase